MSNTPVNVTKISALRDCSRVRRHTALPVHTVHSHQICSHREREKFTKVILIVNELVGSMITEMVIMGIVIHGTLIIDTAAVTEARYCVTTDWSSCLL